MTSTVDTHKITPAGTTQLAQAARNHQLEKVTELVAMGADVNRANKLGYTPLHFAVNSYAITVFLLQQGADPNKANRHQHLPLHFAVDCLNRQTFDVLLERTRNIKHTDENRNTILHLCVPFNDLELIQRILNIGIEIDARNTEGQTPLMCAACRADLGVVKFLIDKGADFLLKDAQNRTAARLARDNGKTINALLLEEYELLHRIP